jgi:hypothetical protein
VIFGLFGWSFHRAKKSASKGFLQFSAGLPDWLTVEDKGLKSDGPNGASAFRPWSNFKGWRDRGRVILLDLESGGFMILPIAGRSDAERQSILQLLGSHIHMYPSAPVSR